MFLSGGSPKAFFSSMKGINFLALEKIIPVMKYFEVRGTIEAKTGGNSFELFPPVGA